ncbi:MAG TPA: hypothetical protein VF210_00070 [Pseudomonadales bacterium]
MTRIVLTVLMALASAPALAYVGPGAGLTLLSALWGLLVAVLAAMAFLVLWPIRRWRRRRQQALEAAGEMSEGAPKTSGSHASREQ